MGKILKEFDLICVGGGVSEYMLAALYAKDGASILLVDNHEIDSSDDELVFGWTEDSIFFKTIHKLGFENDFRTFIEPVKDLFRIAFPDSRLLFTTDYERMKQELQLEFHSNFSKIWSQFKPIIDLMRSDSDTFFYNSLYINQASRSQYVELKKKLEGSFESLEANQLISVASNFNDFNPKICAFFQLFSSALSGVLSYSSPLNQSTEHLIRMLAVSMGKVSRIKGGRSCIKKLIKKSIMQHKNVDFCQGHVSELICEKSKITGVLFDSIEGYIRSKYIAIGEDFTKLYETLPEHYRDNRTLNQLRKVVPAHWKFSVPFSLPVRLFHGFFTENSGSELVYISNPDQPLEEDNFISIKFKLSDIDSQICDVTISGLVPYQVSNLDYKYLRVLTGKFLQQMSEIFPVIKSDEYFKIIQSQIPTIDWIRKKYPISGKKWIKTSRTYYYVQGGKGVQNFWGIPWSTPHNNLWFLGPAVFPSMGIQGEFLAAINVYKDLSSRI